MKKIIFISCIILLMSCLTLKKVTFSPDEFVRVYENLSGSKNELFLKANDWMVRTFKSAKSVIQLSDKEEGILLGKYILHSDVLVSLGGPVESNIYAIIDIRVKDNKARLQIQPENYTSPNFTKEQAMVVLEDLAADFSKAMKSGKIDF